MTTEPNNNDVLLGRGPNFSKYEGNLRFHKIVDERKQEYNSTSNRQDKKRIAKEVVAQVHASGGRFLKQQDPNDPHNEIWCEVEAPVSEEKAKQALREKEYRKPSNLFSEELSVEETASTSSLASHLELLLSREENLSYGIPSYIPPSLSSHELKMSSTLNLFGSSSMNPSFAPSRPVQETSLSSSLDPRLCLLQDNLITGNPQGLNLRPLLSTTLALRSQLANLTELEAATKLRVLLLQQLNNQARVDAAVAEMSRCTTTATRWAQAANQGWRDRLLFELGSSQGCSNDINGSCSGVSGDTLIPTPAEKTAAFALSSLAIQGRNETNKGGDSAKRNLDFDDKKEATETVTPRKKRARRDMGRSE